VVNPPRSPQVREWNYKADAVRLRRGDEMGRFLLGSTVVLLFPVNTMALNPQWTATQPVRLGEAMGSVT
jgi:phosphatidylserine decarboxylase